MMRSSNFARLHGYQEERPAYTSRDYLPDEVRIQGGMMLAESFERVIEPADNATIEIKEGLAWPHKLAHQRFAELVVHSLPDSPRTRKWYRDTIHRVLEMTNLNAWRVRRRLVVPLARCDWRFFYQLVENVHAVTSSVGLRPPHDFTLGFNLLLRTHGIPWMLQSGWVIPVDDDLIGGDLEWVRQAGQHTASGDFSNPHKLLKDALDALYRKQPGPDLSSACVNAWGAWKAAAGESSGHGERDKRAFDWVKSNYPKLHDTMSAWQKLAESGRHPESEGSPNESETRFIVMLCVNAVRFLMSTRDNEADA